LPIKAFSLKIQFKKGGKPMPNCVKKYLPLFVLLAALLLANTLLGCETQTGTAPVDKQQAEATVHFTDDDGREIALAAPRTRIISLYSAHTENLFSLGAGDLIIGVHEASIYPPETQKIPIYDYNADPETIIAAEPDLVLIRPFITRKVPEFVEALEIAGIPVVSLYPEKFEGFEDYINKLALLTDTEAAAVEQLTLFYRNIAEITALTKNITDKQNIFFEATEVNLRTITDDAMPAQAIAFAGGLNVAAGAVPVQENSSIASCGEERVLALADEIDVYVSQRGAMNAGSNLHSILTRPGFDTIKAVRNGRVYVINEKIISSPTFRFYKGVRELARYLYPQVMDDLGAHQNDGAATKRDLANIMVRQLHIPIYITSSSKYYQTETEGHIYGMFNDVTWLDDDFDYIETAAMGGYIPYTTDDEGRQFFAPNTPVTREMLAGAVFILGNFTHQKNNISIADLGQCGKPDIVQSLVDNGVFLLHDGNFEPARAVTCAEIIDALAHVSFTPTEQP
jgi:iron complex transport system substrate-binding protein